MKHSPWNRSWRARFDQVARPGRAWAAALLAVALLAAAWPVTVSAQWVTQANSLRPGWNSVYLHVDTTHTNINGLVNLTDPIEEIWLWNADLPPSQALVQPQSPVPGSQWSVWTRAQGANSELTTLRGNSAMLVRVNESSTGFNWSVKGRPVTPTYRWTLSGLNFVGFPAVTPGPFFDAFLSRDGQALDWAQDAEIFRYQGGTLGATNPIIVPPIAHRLTQVRRDQAYWVRSGAIYNQYFGPFQVSGVGAAGLRFDDSTGAQRLVLKNVTDTNLTVTLRQLPSETPPIGFPVPAGTLPLLVRGPINTTNLTYGYTALGSGGAGVSWTLTPKGRVGSEVEIVLGVNRSQLSGAPGTAYAGVLRLTDSLGLTRVEFGATAVTPSRTGLWVGEASVSYVSQYLKPYAKANSEAEFNALLGRLQLSQGGNGYRYEWDPNTGRVLVFGGPDNRLGSYLLDGPIKLDSGGVPRPYPLRLIVHNTGSSASLLQRAYIGFGQSSNQVVATREEALMATRLASARRISATHLPTSDGNTPWPFTGQLQEGAALTATVNLAHDDHSSNPFLHTYHPDHDNLDARFDQELPRGQESYGVRRLISLQVSAAANDFDSLTRSAGHLRGNYSETLTFLDRNGDAKQFNVLGTFHLNRILDIATLTTQ